jgi:hypothetical protein
MRAAVVLQDLGASRTPGAGGAASETFGDDLCLCQRDVRCLIPRREHADQRFTGPRPKTSDWSRPAGAPGRPPRSGRRARRR